jgi:hypothetical protein
LRFDARLEISTIPVFLLLAHGHYNSIAPNTK